MTPPTRARTSLPSVPPRGARPGVVLASTHRSSDDATCRANIPRATVRYLHKLRSTCPTDSSNSNILVPRSAVKVHTAPARGALEMPAVVESATFPPQLAMNNPAGASAPPPGTPADQIASKVDASVVAVARPDPAPSNPSRAPRPVGWWVRDAELHAGDARRRRGRPRSRLGQEQGLSLVARATRRRGVPQSGEPRRAPPARSVRRLPVLRQHRIPVDPPSCPRLPIQSFSEGWKLADTGRCPSARRSWRASETRAPSPWTLAHPRRFLRPRPHPLSPPQKKRKRDRSPGVWVPATPPTNPRASVQRRTPRTARKTPNPPSPPRSELAARAKAEKEAARLAAEAAKPKIKWPLLTSLTVFPRSADFATPAVSEFTLPFDVRREGKPPRYDRVNRSVWVSSAAPRPFSRDEVEACLCQPAPEVAVAMLAARETAGGRRQARGEGERAAAAAANAASDETGSANAEAGADASLVKSAGGRGSGCLRRGGGRSGADGLRRGGQSFVPHDVPPARVSLRALSSNRPLHLQGRRRRRESC